MDDRKTLERRLDLARTRCDSQPPYSPDWDAAMGAVDDLVERLQKLADTEVVVSA